MAINTKAIKNRIKSVKNTKKITKAMEMVSAAKMRRSVEATLATRTYASLARELMQHLAHMDAKKIALLETRPVNNVLVILISSNRGLCGSFNTNIFKKTAAFLRDMAVTDSANIHVIGLGKKSALFAKKQGYALPAVFDEMSEKPDMEDVLPITKMAIDGFTSGLYDTVVVAYTDYKSSLSQEPKVRQLLPVSKQDIDEMANELGPDGNHSVVAEKERLFSIDQYVFEPNVETILTYVLPRLVEIQLYQSILESAASEHSARMMAMRNASDAATDMIGSLNVSFNKARQAAITQEIAEIAGGAAALG